MPKINAKGIFYINTQKYKTQSKNKQAQEKVRGSRKGQKVYWKPHIGVRNVLVLQLLDEERQKSFQHFKDLTNDQLSASRSDFNANLF